MTNTDYKPAQKALYNHRIFSYKPFFVSSYKPQSFVFFSAVFIPFKIYLNFEVTIIQA